MKSSRVYAIILASGKGERLNCGFPKQFLTIKDKTLVEYTIEAFEKNKNVDSIIVVIEPASREKLNEILEKAHYTKVSEIVDGGKTRFESSVNGVNAVPEKGAKVLIHDAARPFVSQRIIDDTIQALDKYPAVETAIRATDTIIERNDEFMLSATTDRARMMQVQTPQGFSLGVIKMAQEMAKNDKNLEATDDCGLVFKYGICDVFVVEGERQNIKITYPEDILFANYVVDALNF